MATYVAFLRVIRAVGTPAFPSISFQEEYRRLRLANVWVLTASIDSEADYPYCFDIDTSNWIESVVEVKDASRSDLAQLAAQIVVAYVGNNQLERTALAGLIASVMDGLSRTSSGEAKPAEETAPVPAVAVKKSITDDFIVCLEDGKKFKSLRRHLATRYGLSPDEYRRKWGLPADYPMVAPNYAAARSALARASGLGQKRKAVAPPPEPVAPSPKRRGPRKAKQAA